MSFNQNPDSNQTSKVTIKTLQELKNTKQKIVSLTAYDYPTGRLVDEAGVDFVLVGDSVANVVLGYENTLSVSLDEMLLFTKAVRRGVKRSLLVGDMPFGSYHVNTKRAVTAAIRFIKEAGAEAIKLEGGSKRAKLVKRIVESEIPVMGHIGLTPQSVNSMGGYKVQGKTSEDANKLFEDAKALEDAGAFAIVLEGIPGEIASQITTHLKIPTIGIGAGINCDGQILVLWDVLGLNFGHKPRFVRSYLDLRKTATEALATYASDVRLCQFPSREETYTLYKNSTDCLKKSSASFV